MASPRKRGLAPRIRYTGTHVGAVRSPDGALVEEDEGYDITGLLLTAEVISETICDSDPSFLDTTSSPSDY